MTEQVVTVQTKKKREIFGGMEDNSYKSELLGGEGQKVVDYLFRYKNLGLLNEDSRKQLQNN